MGNLEWNKKIFGLIKNKNQKKPQTTTPTAPKTYMMNNPSTSHKKCWDKEVIQS